MSRRILPLLLSVIFIGGLIWAQESNHKAALRQLVEKASAGDAKSLFELARLHDIGYDTIPVDSARSTALYFLSAEKGYGPAINFIGFRYYKGEVLPHDVDSALYWIRLAAEEGDITAAANLGYLLHDSEDVVHDDAEAAHWLDIASRSGMPEAQEKLVEIKKRQWESLPADSALNLGLEYYNDSAPVAAVVLLNRAASQGDAKAMALLGDAYSKGLGVVYDHDKSIEYFYLAAEEGDPAAEFIIAELLEFFPDSLGNLKIKVEEDKKSPEYWYSKAAQVGVSDSESAYKLLYSPRISQPE